MEGTDVGRDPYFELQAEWGMTKHMGGLGATRELAGMCHIERGAHVLDVGCGVGHSACRLAQEFDCRVIGVDIHEKMVDRARERARKRGLEEKVEFRVADAQDLPFGNDIFDAVISESVTAFLDKPRATSEYARVTKPGGYVGLNETTWLQTPPGELAAYLFRNAGGVRPETSAVWVGLMENSGLREIVARVCRIEPARQFLEEIKMAGLADLFKAWGRFFAMYLGKPGFRKVLKGMAREAWKMPRNIFQYHGYGLYVGRK